MKTLSDDLMMLESILKSLNMKWLANAIWDIKDQDSYIEMLLLVKKIAYHQERSDLIADMQVHCLIY